MKEGRMMTAAAELEGKKVATMAMAMGEDGMEVLQLLLQIPLISAQHTPLGEATTTTHLLDTRALAPAQ